MLKDVASENRTQSLLAELATATYRAARRQGFKDAFIDIELDLWYAHQAAVGESKSVTRGLVGAKDCIR
jgi:hypothetical protein